MSSQPHHLDPRKPKDVVYSYLSSFASRDPELIASHVTTDFENRHAAALGTGCIGRAAYLERLPSFLADMVNLEYEPIRLIQEDGWVSASYLLTACWKGLTPISIDGVQLFRLEDGLIAERTDYWDSASFLIQADDKAAEMLATFGVSEP